MKQMFSRLREVASTFLQLIGCLDWQSLLSLDIVDPSFLVDLVVKMLDIKDMEQATAGIFRPRQVFLEYWRTGTARTRAPPIGGPAREHN